MKAIRKGTGEREFARRLDQSLSRHPLAPEGHGRNTWLMRELTHQSVQVSLETIRKWLAGEVIPRRPKIAALARTLEVDETWLSMGVQPPPAGLTLGRLAELEGALHQIAKMSDDPAIQDLIAQTMGQNT